MPERHTRDDSACDLCGSFHLKTELHKVAVTVKGKDRNRLACHICVKRLTTKARRGPE